MSLDAARPDDKWYSLALSVGLPSALKGFIVDLRAVITSSTSQLSRIIMYDFDSCDDSSRFDKPAI